MGATPERWTVGVLLAGGALARWLACGTDLWFDEIWSIEQVSGLSSPVGILTTLHHDNNHHLNSLYLYWVGMPQAFPAYRLHSLAASVVSVWLGWAIVRSRGRTEALVASFLLASSYLLIHYGSEARGYALAVCFAYASFLATRRFLGRPSARRALVVWGLTCLGFLSHLSFLHAFLGIAAWVGSALARSEPARRAVPHAVLLLLPPVLFLLGLYRVDLRFLRIGGGPDFEIARVVAGTLSLMGGGPARGPGALAVGGLMGAASLLALALAWRRRGDERFFFLVTVLVSPALVLAARPPEVLFERYFLIPVAFALLLLAEGLVALARRGRAAAVAAGIALALVTAGNGVHLGELLSRGRGSFDRLLRVMQEREPTATLRVTGSRERLDRMMLWFYGRTLLPEAEIRYFPANSRMRERADWRIVSALEAPELRLESTAGGGRWTLVSVHAAPPLVAPHWTLYRRASAAPLLDPASEGR